MSDYMTPEDLKRLRKLKAEADARQADYLPLRDGPMTAAQDAAQSGWLASQAAVDDFLDQWPGRS